MPRTISMTLTLTYYSAVPVQVHSPRMSPNHLVLTPFQPSDKPFRDDCAALWRLVHRLVHRVPAGLMLQGTIPASRRAWELLSHARSTGLVQSWSVLTCAWSSVPSAPGPSPLTPAVSLRRGRVPACLGAHHHPSQQDAAGGGSAVTLQGAAPLLGGNFVPVMEKCLQKRTKQDMNAL